MTTHTTTCETCGRTFTSRHEKNARRSLNVHSCAKWIAKQESAKRRIARAAAVDRQPKPCHHKRARHEHGTHACYVLDRCRCPDCTAANTAYERQRGRLHAYGRFTHMVDAQPVRDHIERLQAHGLGLKTIGRRAGVSQSALGKLVYGSPVHGHQRSKRVKAETAAKILAVRPSLDTLADGANVDGTGTRRRLQALVAIGWSQSRLADAIGYELRNLSYMLHGRRDVTAKTARNVRALYDQLWNTPPPQSDRWERSAYSRSIGYAAARGWAPPLAWDDDALDDPAATPHVEQAPAPVRGRPTADIAEDVAWFLDDEPLATAQRVADRLRLSANHLQIVLKRAERHDLLAQLARNARLNREGSAA